MCYPKPGPRCSAHAKTALDKAIASNDKAAILVAQDNYDETEAGQNDLLVQIQQIEVSGQSALELRSRRKVAGLRYRDKKRRLKEVIKEQRAASAFTRPVPPEKVLFRTQHGSHLYGLSHANSDQDFYEVHLGNLYDKPEQKIVNGIDTVKVSLGTFMKLAASGNPQALETMFAPGNDTDALSALRSNFRADVSISREVYGRTILNFVSGNFKSRRHALRLALNYEQISRTGRFNPELSDNDKTRITDMARDENYAEHLSQMFPYIDKEKYFEKGFSLENLSS